MSRAAPAPAPGDGEGGTRLVTISHVLSLANALTEAVGVQDVVRLVADEIAPTGGGKALVILGSHGGRHVLGRRGYPDPSAVERWNGVPLTAPVPGTHVLTSGVPAFFDSRQQLEHLYPARHRTPDGMAAWASLPLIASGRPVGTWVLDLAGEPLLGIEGPVGYPTTEFALAPGAVLALCSDGLIGFPGVDIEDALADLGEVFADGDDESLESLADRLIRDMSAEERLDDVTLLFLRARTAS